MRDRYRHRCGLATVIGGVALAVAVSAQAPHQHQGQGDTSAATDPHRRVDTVIRESEDVIASGRGFGMAFAADQNGYPGPMHAVELREPLGLTAAQVAELDALTESMFAASRPRSRELLDAEARLRRRFAAREATEVSVRSLVREIERLRADVRMIHLQAHLQAFDVLTEHQRRLYGQIRWSEPR